MKYFVAVKTRILGSLTAVLYLKLYVNVYPHLHLSDEML